MFACLIGLQMCTQKSGNFSQDLYVWFCDEVDAAARSLGEQTAGGQIPGSGGDTNQLEGDPCLPAAIQSRGPLNGSCVHVFEAVRPCLLRC